MLKSMNEITEVKVRSRSRSCSQNKHIEKVNANSAPAQSSQKWLSTMGSLKKISMLNHYNNEAVWQCAESLQRAERKLLEMEKNKPAEINFEDGGQMSERESQHSPGIQPGYGTGAKMTNLKTKPQTTGVTSGGLHRAFVLKVDCFTTVLLAITIGIISGLTYWNMLQGWQQKSIWFWCKCLTATIILWFVIPCCENNCKKFPLNLILPLMITIVEGLMLGVVSSFFAAVTIMQVGGITAFVTLVLSWFALKSKWYITRVAVSPLIVFPGLVIFGMLCIFIKSPTLQLTYALLGTLIFATCLMKTQVRIRRESTEDQEPMDYAALALNLYMNIVTLFFFILKLMEQVNRLDWGSQPQRQGPHELFAGFSAGRVERM
ncbi:protein lifeguard 1-like [Emydura macquarii macquarii]|uniref:protein lifeguard 1-like n=1 Tax=Emydura macquarii macquarii TaxID=1129001 RepID=UPI00352A5685